MGLRVGTFNLQSGTPSTPLKVDEAIRQTADRLAAERLDILALQEVSMPRGQSRPPLRVITDVAGMAWMQFAAARRAPTDMIYRVARRQEYGYGVVLATREPPMFCKSLRLPSWKSPVRRDRTGRRGIAGRYLRVEEQRRAVVVILNMDGGPLLVCATHLAADARLNSRELVWLENRLAGIARHAGVASAPRLLLGDLNMSLEKVRRESSFTVLAQGATFPAASPRTQIDHILGQNLVSCAESSVVHLPISDHRALLTEVARG
ncbi:endonuclease/exonuclease/phosphatase family protein [Actinobaculum sp. 352]|uniref:endonuclease/exonuclease/phosphatase family protein n=1 Tax=Actinobaculum sp. 352 TaxID=2490946 RepID=UPI000F7D6FDB|nr:endonuclease/exonuclease/phosphatase family protein [Actinobaculum sp. 352]RTE48564.1 hypothetical protein EKN07_09385 [Actinobaculum sp. 352]